MLVFKDILGHEQIKEHFQNAVRTGSVSHAYILSGEAGMDRLWETLPWIVGGLMLALALAAMRRPLGALVRLGLRTGVGLGVLWVLSFAGGVLGLRLGAPGLGLLAAMNWALAG